MAAATSASGLGATRKAPTMAEDGGRHPRAVQEDGPTCLESRKRSKRTHGGQSNLLTCVGNGRAEVKRRNCEEGERTRML